VFKAKRKIAVVTGASAGVGRATARLFARKGWDLGLIARGHAGLEAARREAEDTGARVLTLPLDVADSQAIEQAAQRIETELGPIDVWVNNAMVSVFSPVKQMQADEYKRVTDVTYMGVVHGTLAALKRMLPRNHGVIIQVGSALAYRSIPLQSAYCAAKHAMIGFTDSLRCELIHDHSKVRVTVVHPPALNTPQFKWTRSRMPRKAQPVPPIFQPEVAAEAIVWAASHNRREVLVGAPTVTAIQANKFAPGLLDRYLGESGYDGQQYDGVEDPTRPDNLWSPVDRDFGAHGDFDNRAHAFSLQFWLNKNGQVLLAIGAALGITALTLRQTREPSQGKMKTVA
jgi:short-subunit dehydrogenase